MGDVILKHIPSVRVVRHADLEFDIGPTYSEARAIEISSLSRLGASSIRVPAFSSSTSFFAKEQSAQLFCIVIRPSHI